MTVKVITWQELLSPKYKGFRQSMYGNASIKEVSGYKRDVFVHGDPDYIRLKTGRNKGLPFFEQIDKAAGIHYVVTPSKYSGKVNELLIAFFSDADHKRFEGIEDSWDAYYKNKEVIAYRGGRGYSYTIWKYKQSKGFFGF